MPEEEESWIFAAFPHGAELAYTRLGPLDGGVSEAANDVGSDTAVLCSRRFSAVRADGRVEAEE